MKTSELHLKPVYSHAPPKAGEFRHLAIGIERIVVPRSDPVHDGLIAVCKEFVRPVYSVRFVVLREIGCLEEIENNEMEELDWNGMISTEMDTFKRMK